MAKFKGQLRGQPCNNAITRIVVIIFCLISGLVCFSSEVTAQVISKSDPQSIVLANNRAYWLYSHGRYDESITILKQVLDQQDNVIADYMLGCIYNTEQNYAEAVKYSERAQKLDTGFNNVYAQLFTAYYGTERWDDALRVSEKAAKYGKNNDTEAMLQVMDYSIKAGIFSKVMGFMIFMILIGIFFIPIYLNTTKANDRPADNGGFRVVEIVLVSSSVSCLLWAGFFSISKWIWSFNPPISPGDIVNYVRGFIFEHDGIQSFFLYAMMLTNLCLTLVATSFITKVKKNANTYNAFFTVLLLLTGYYIYTIGFFPPLAAIEPFNVFLPAALVLLAVGLYLLYQKSTLLAKIAVILLVAFTGLICLGPSSSVDFMFLLAPALRLMHGFTIRETYFQYDLYISFLLLAWMKMKIAIDWFPYVGQVTYFLLFIGAFFFADGFFKTKGYSMFFIVAFVLVRFYTVWADNPTILQVTPMRLDLWMILLLVVSKKGVNHWLLGVFLGLLVLFHRNLGIIYVLAYMELIFALFLLDIVPLVQNKDMSVKSFSGLLMKHLRQNGINLIFIGASVALCFILFHEMFSKSALLYTKLGLGLKPIERNSFYGYISILLGCLISFIIYFKNKLGSKYITTALFVVLLVIGNSMYFFGRSHENNILNISGILVIALFVLFDILIFLAPSSMPTVITEAAVLKNKKRPQPAVAHETTRKFKLTKKMILMSLPAIFIFFVGYTYSARIEEKVKTQYTNLTDLNFAFPFAALPIDTASIRQVTHDSKKVYVIDFWYDAFYCYYNDYAPQGFFSPCQSWVYKKDFVVFLQGLLDQGYYIGYDIRGYNRYVEYFCELNYNQTVQKNYMVAISKVDVPYLLPHKANDLLHVAIGDSLATNGLDYHPIKLKDSFTLEVVFNPLDGQAPNAAIVDNLSSFDGPKGFTLRLNSNNQNQFVFGFSNGMNNMPNNVFLLDYNKWHYLVITENNEFLKIYDNGKMITSMASGGRPIANSENDVTIGNQANLASQFHGYIREVKISDGNITESEMVDNLNKLQTGMK